MFVQQFFIKGIAHSSYLLGATETCAIVDPARDIDIYLEAAKDMDMKITHVIETHLHADFISGHMDLAEVTGAEIIAPKPAECKFPHKAVKEGDVFKIEDLEISVLETPGHTPEHVSYVVVDHARGDDPVSLFCGDTLFVGDVGRPDLFPGKSQELAEKLYDSLFNKIMKLPDCVEVLPAHGAGSLCGRAMGAKRTSTIGYERKYNEALQLKDMSDFVKSLTTDMPEAPDHFARCSDINRIGPRKLNELPTMPALEPAQFKELMEKEKAIILDVRPFESFGGGHIPGSWHLDVSGNFATFAGWVLPPDKKILLVVPTDEVAEEARMWLRRVGLDDVIGYLKGSIYSWAKAGFDLDHVNQLSIRDMHNLITGKSSVNLVDVRSRKEYEGNNVKGTLNIAAPDVRSRYEEIPKDVNTLIICNSGHRSSLAASILKQKGIHNIYNVAGGMTAYAAAGFAPECTVCVAPHGPKFMGKEMK